MRVRRKTDVQDEAVGVRCYPGQIAQIVILETDHPARPVTLINFSKGVEKDRSCVSSSWLWLQRPELRARERSEQ